MSVGLVQTLYPATACPNPAPQGEAVQLPASMVCLVRVTGTERAREEVSFVDRSEGSPEDAPDLWAEALWGAGLLGSVLVIVALVSLLFR
jgi:hypothetical protein